LEAQKRRKPNEIGAPGGTVIARRRKSGDFKLEVELYQDCQTIQRVLSSTSVTTPLKNGKGELRISWLASLALGKPQTTDEIEDDYDRVRWI
jgi:hypothetical protein